MYDLQNLESEWRRYKRKRILMIVFMAFLVVLMLSAAYVFLPSARSNVSENNQKHDPIPSAKKEPAPENIERRALTPEVPSVVRKPSTKKGWHMTFAGSDEAKKTADVLPKTKHVDIRVHTKKTEYTVKEIEDRFRFAKDKDDALFLARYFYDKKQYKKALNWALETNKLDSDIEESWLLFGRAKAKLGQRMEAIRVLQAYYDRTGSKKSKKLLDTIRRGTAF